MSISMLWPRLLSVAVAAPALSLSALALSAQTPAPAQQRPAGQPAKPAAPAAKPAAAPVDEAEKLRGRVEQLEEQLVDLQVVIGTLESLAKPPAASAASADAGNEAARIQALEAQLKSLSGQIEQLGEKVRSAGEPTRRSETFKPSPAAPALAQPAPAAPSAVQPGQVLPPLDEQSPPSTTSIGSSTVTSAHPDTGTPSPAGPPASADAPPPAAGGTPPPLGASGTPEADVAAIDPGSGDPKHDYETAYSYVIQRDYGAAQAGFTEFLKRYPKDALVPNALYWLGETHYQQRNFADAAEAFDLVIRIYRTSPKAPDSLLKRALSLSALGKNSEACAALGELDKNFQNAPGYVKTRAGSERRRLACG